MRLLPWFLLLALVVPLVPLAEAAHTMGHRYLVHGRVLDGAGMPAQNRDVQIRILKDGVSEASITTSTNCVGDFASWQGQPGNDPPGGGRLEPSVRDPATGQQTYAFHYHDPELSDRLVVQLFVQSEMWNESFHSKTRQTVVRHQLAQALAPACGDYDEFNTTVAVRVSVLAPAELATGETEPRVRQVTVRFGEGDAAPSVSGSTDFNGAFFGRAENLTLAQGMQVHIEATDIDDKSVALDGDVLKYRRLDGVYNVGASVSGVLDDLKNFGIGAVIVALVIVVFFAGRRLKGRVDQRRLRETTTRKRFRRGEQP